MHWKLQCLQLALVNRMGPILHDNAWLHVAQPTLQKLNELGYKALPHPPYSLDLSPVNYRRRQWHPTAVLLPGKSHGRRSLVGCSPWGCEESDTTEQLHFPFSLSCIGEGNGNPLQCSCLENPRDGKPGGLPSMGSHRVGNDWSDLAAAAAATDYHFFKHLDNVFQGKCFHNQQKAENAFQEFIESWSTDFYAIKINLFCHGKNMLIVIIPILITKDVFEPSYNDLKLMIQNCNYFCT